MRLRILRILEIATLAAGLGLVTFYSAARLDGYFASRTAIASFEASARRLSSPTPAPKARAPATQLGAAAQVDLSLWSAGRVRSYRRSLAQDPGRPLALLRIPTIELTVPVFDGTGALTLNRGVGRIRGTALPGKPGNLAIAGHRDGFFRGLKGLRRGDVVELLLPGRTERFVVDRIAVVSPENLSVLAPRPVSSLTLVTCYPFYYLGRAPKRYVVEASLQGEAGNYRQRSGPSRLDAFGGEKRK